MKDLWNQTQLNHIQISMLKHEDKPGNLFQFLFEFFLSIILTHREESTINDNICSSFSIQISMLKQEGKTCNLSFFAEKFFINDTNAWGISNYFLVLLDGLTLFLAFGSPIDLSSVACLLAYYVSYPSFFSFLFVSLLC